VKLGKGQLGWRLAGSVLFLKLFFGLILIPHTSDSKKCFMRQLEGMLKLYPSACNKAFLSWEKHRTEGQVQNYLILDFLKL
jgi:hypothetical protein